VTTSSCRQPGVAYGYVRASTRDQHDTLVIQKREVEDCYRAQYAPKGYAWGGVFEDAAVSGGLPFHRREEGGRLWNLLAAGDVVILHRQDRGFRDLEDFAWSVKLWNDLGVRVKILNLDVDSGTSGGKLILHILAALGEWERDQTVERTAAWASERKRRGLPGPGRYPPYGLTRVGPRGQKRYRENAAQREVGRAIVRWMQAGWSIDQIHRHLLKESIKNPNTGLPLGRASVWRWYTGELSLQAAEALQDNREKEEGRDDAARGGVPLRHLPAPPVGADP
jgi:DNA invertase Pin-like site-specific DNA recombinase